jgi:hypothetical protein
VTWIVLIDAVLAGSVRRRLKITDTARGDLLEIWSFIAGDNPKAADKLPGWRKDLPRGRQ